jgi:hypothetical protein
VNKIISLLIIGLFILSFVGASGDHGTVFAEAEEIIEQKISCEELNDEQLEALGDYYMEQMHPGEAHEVMDEMLGGEGSESLKEIHINMGRAFYCGEHGAMSGEMMDMMMSRNGMMRGDGMMSGNYGNNLFIWVFWFLLIVALVLLIVWLIRQLQEKPRHRRRKR